MQVPPFTSLAGRIPAGLFLGTLRDPGEPVLPATVFRHYAYSHPMHLFLNLLISTLWLTMLIVAVRDCLKSKNEHKAGWIAVVLLLPLLGPIFYFQFAQGRYVSEL